MFLFTLLLVFGGGNLYQSHFELCKEIDYKSKKCEFHKKMVERNYKSIHHKK